MLIEFDKIEDVTSNGLESWTCTNCVSGHDISIHEDMLGDFVAIVEKRLDDGTFESYEEVFTHVWDAMLWCECPTRDNPVVLTTSFGA